MPGSKPLFCGFYSFIYLFCLRSKPDNVVEKPGSYFCFGFLVVVVVVVVGSLSLSLSLSLLPLSSSKSGILIEINLFKEEKGKKEKN